MKQRKHSPHNLKKKKKPSNCQGSKNKKVRNSINMIKYIDYDSITLRLGLKKQILTNQINIQTKKFKMQTQK